MKRRSSYRGSEPTSSRLPLIVGGLVLLALAGGFLYLVNVAGSAAAGAPSQRVQLDVVLPN